MHRYFLAKTDPDTYSIQDLESEKTTFWDGVNNRQAINVIKAWKKEDLVLIYHSQGTNGIVGLAKIIEDAIPDPKDPKGFSWMAKLEFVKKFDSNQVITLKQIKESGQFNDFLLVKQGRLSTMECPPKFITWLKDNGLPI